MMTAHEYRNHAERCVKLAKDAVTPEMRDEMFALAKRWTRLAEEREQELRVITKGRSADVVHIFPRSR